MFEFQTCIKKKIIMEGSEDKKINPINEMLCDAFIEVTGDDLLIPNHVDWIGGELIDPVYIFDDIIYTRL